MNYRHAYHVGNIGDVLKHAVLSRLIVYFQKKNKAFRLLDTHAGIGRYDLTSEAALKTGEWQNGIAKILDAAMPDEVAGLLSPWLSVLRDLNPDGKLSVYPGSPWLARKLLRPNDRLTLTELHPEDVRTLSDLFAGDHQVKTIHLDGWLALGSFLPPKEKRGLVLIDPAFEALNDFERMTAAVLTGWKKWPSGTYALWYPLKDMKAVTRMHGAFKEAGLRDLLSLELRAGKSGPDTKMFGSGMTLINPPYTLAAEMHCLLPWFSAVLHQGPGSGWAVTQVIEE